VHEGVSVTTSTGYWIVVVEVEVCYGYGVVGTICNMYVVL
jgi:hypothetical protein